MPDMNRRKFIPSLFSAALLPPMPPGSTVLRSPKDAEHVASLRKLTTVSAQIVARPTPAAVSPLSVSIVQSQGMVTLTWSGIKGPYLVERSFLDGQWESKAKETVAQSMTLPILGTFDTFRVSGNRIMSLTAEQIKGTTHLSWVVPDAATITSYTLQRSTTGSAGNPQTGEPGALTGTIETFGSGGLPPGPDANTTSFDDPTTPSPTFFYRLTATFQ